MRVRLLHLEDDESDRELVRRTLLAEGIDCEVVEADCREDFEHAFDEPPDLILSDYSIPGFSGDEAQDVARSRCPGVPFMFVSGSIGEERAVERLKNDPDHQWLLRSSVTLSAVHEVDAMVRHVDDLPNPVVPASTAVDAR